MRITKANAQKYLTKSLIYSYNEIINNCDEVFVPSSIYDLIVYEGLFKAERKDKKMIRADEINIPNKHWTKTDFKIS